MRILLIIFFVLSLDQFSAASPTKPAADKNKPINNVHLYQINLAALTPLYDISDPKKVNQIKGSYQFSGREMIAAEEIITRDNKRYLKIPYYENSVPSKNKVYLLEYGTPSIDGEYGVTYKATLTGGPHEKVSSIFNKKDHYVFLDRPGGVRVSLAKNPGEDSEDSTKTIVGPSSKNQLKIFDSRIAEFTDPHSKKVRRQVYYKVSTNVCPDSNINSSTGVTQCTDIFGWLPAKDTIEFQREDNLLDDGIASQVQILKDNKNQRENSKLEDCPPNFSKDAKLLANDEIMKALNHLTDVLGVCVGNNSEQNIKTKLAAEEKPNRKEQPKKTPFDLFLRSYWSNSSSEEKEKQQLFAIDSMARALYGEMRGCAKNSTGNLKIVARVLLNRSLAFNGNQGQIEHFFSPVGVADFEEQKKISNQGKAYQMPLRMAIPHTVSSPGQVSSFNENDPNLKVNLCPKGGMIENSDDQAAWKKCIEVASEAVMNPKKLIKETPNIDAMYYSSESDDGKPPKFAVDYKMKRTATFLITNGHKKIKLNNPRCLALWRTQPEDDKTYEFYSNIQKLNEYQGKLIDPIASGLIK